MSKVRPEAYHEGKGHPDGQGRKSKRMNAAEQKLERSILVLATVVDDVEIVEKGKVANSAAKRIIIVTAVIKQKKMVTNAIHSALTRISMRQMSIIYCE